MIMNSLQHIKDHIKSKRTRKPIDITGEIETDYLQPKIEKKTVILKYDPKEKRSKVMIVKTDKSILGEGRETLVDYSQETKRLIDTSNSPEKEMENLLNAGRFRRMSNRFQPGGLFQEDIEYEAAIEYYTNRKQGHTIARSFMAAKFKAFHIALEYYRLNRRYDPKEDCECDNCCLGRPSKCLNGIPVIRPEIDEISIDSTRSNGQLVSDLIALETPDKYQDWTWTMRQIKTLYEICNDWRDKRIIDGLREGINQKDIATDINATQQTVSKRLHGISERFLALDEVKTEIDLTEINARLLKDYGLNNRV